MARESCSKTCLVISQIFEFSGSPGRDALLLGVN